MTTAAAARPIARAAGTGGTSSDDGRTGIGRGDTGKESETENGTAMSALTVAAVRRPVAPSGVKVVGVVMVVVGAEGVGGARGAGREGGVRTRRTPLTASVGETGAATHIVCARRSHS